MEVLAFLRWTASCVTGSFSDATMWQVGKGDGQPEWMADMFPKPLAWGTCCHWMAMLEEQAGPRPLRWPEKVTLEITLFGLRSGAFRIPLLAFGSHC